MVQRRSGGKAAKDLKRAKVKISCVVATKDRPSELRRMLGSIASGTYLPEEVIIIDSSRVRDEAIAAEFPTLSIRYQAFTPPSASKQRNLGVQKISSFSNLVALFDDDVVLLPRALEEMALFWQNTDPTTGGACFNMMNHPRMASRGLKSFGLVKRLGLYSPEPGIVMPSGFHTMIGRVSALRRVQWLSSGASVFRRETFSGDGFDPWFEGYSYLEDLDFSYRLGKKWKLYVVPDAGYLHFPGPRGRGNGFAFGFREIMNRVYFVKKNPELSMAKCVLGLMVRGALSFSEAAGSFKGFDWQRAAGNLAGLAALVVGKPPIELR